MALGNLSKVSDLNILVTGATGFVGGEVVGRLAELGPVRTAVRAASGREREIAVGDIGPDTDWGRALDGIDAIVHLANIAHRRATEADLQRVNVRGTERLVRAARAAGVKRFLYLSSVKAAAERSGAMPLRESDEPAPETEYGRSKREAERAVLEETSLSPVVIRPPLVFAADARANFAALLRLAASGAPLPFAGLANRRSLISRDTLTEAVASVLAQADGPTGVFYVSDRPALSTASIVAALRAGMDMPSRLFTAPAALLHLVPAALRSALEVDDGAFRTAYGYGAGMRPNTEAALRKAAAAWMAAR